MCKKTYSRLRATILPVEVEDGFLSCSVKVEGTVEVEQYHGFFHDDKGVDSDFKVSFED